jgi:hypothetical protein
MRHPYHHRHHSSFITAAAIRVMREGSSRYEETGYQAQNQRILFALVVPTTMLIRRWQHIGPFLIFFVFVHQGSAEIIPQHRAMKNNDTMVREPRTLYYWSLLGSFRSSNPLRLTGRGPNREDDLRCLVVWTPRTDFDSNNVRHQVMTSYGRSPVLRANGGKVDAAGGLFFPSLLDQHCQ